MGSISIAQCLHIFFGNHHYGQPWEREKETVTYKSNWRNCEVGFAFTGRIWERWGEPIQAVME